MKKVSLLCLILLTLNSFGKTTIKIIGPSYPGLIEPNGNGEHQRLIKLALQDTDIEISEQILPAKRALFSFIEKDSDCIYSMSKQVKNSLDKNSETLNSKSLSNLRLYIFSKKGSTPIISAEQLNKKKPIGGVLGNEEVYKEVVGNEQKIEYVVKDEQNISKLRKDRISYIFGYLPVMDPYLDELSFKANKPLAEIPDSIICYQNPRTTKFIQTLNQSLSQKSGELKKMSLDRIAQKKKERTIVLLNELLVDILPPPLYIVDVHLDTLQIIVEIINKKVDHSVLVGYLNHAKELFEHTKTSHGLSTFQSQISQWKNFKGHNEVAKISNDYQNGALIFAEKYYGIQQGKFKDAIVKKNYDEAINIYQNQLLSLYNNHRREIDLLVNNILLEKSKAENNFELTNTLNEFLMDILPPPSYIAEPFLLTHRLIFALAKKDMEEANSLKINHAVLEGAQFKDSSSFIATHQKWINIFKNQLSDEKELYQKYLQSHQHAEKYFSNMRKIYASIPNVKLSEKDIYNLNKVIDDEFHNHRIAIVKLVTNTRKRISELKK